MKRKVNIPKKMEVAPGTVPPVKEVAATWPPWSREMNWWRWWRSANIWRINTEFRREQLMHLALQL